MLTVEDLESACDAGQALDFSRHPIEAPELGLRQTFYPLGFPIEVRTNSVTVLRYSQEIWGKFKRRFDFESIQLDVHVTESSQTECPLAPTYRLLRPVLTAVADADNYFISDLARNHTRMTISRATEKHKLYVRYFFLEAIAGCHLSWRHTTPVHAGCVALDGRGVLLMGDPGAGKSSLSFACARAGWTYIADDAVFLLNNGEDRVVTGNCHQVRFRPTAVDLFPEVAGRKITPRAAGKPSIELLTAPMRHIICAQTAKVDFIVFLNRRSSGASELAPYREDVARYFVRQLLFGSTESLAEQYAALDRLLTAEILELRYSDLDWAVERLGLLVRESCLHDHSHSDYLTVE